MNSYFEKLADDYAKMGIDIPYHSTSVHSKNGLDTIYDQVTLSGSLLTLSEKLNKAVILETVNPEGLATSLAQRAFELSTMDISYDTKRYCCELSEPRLVQAIDPDAVANPVLKSPIMVMHNGTPAAIIKRFGERTLYGIEDIPEYNIYAGLFHAADNAISLIDSFPASDGIIELSLSQLVPADIKPIRFATFNFPEEVRSNFNLEDETSEVQAPIMPLYSRDEVRDKILALHSASKRDVSAIAA